MIQLYWKDFLNDTITYLSKLTDKNYSLVCFCLQGMLFLLLSHVKKYLTSLVVKILKNQKSPLTEI